MLKKIILTLVMFFSLVFVHGQITYSDGGTCAGDLTFSTTMMDGTGRNIYTAIFGETTLVFRYNPGNAGWELVQINSDSSEGLLNESPEICSPNPPDFNWSGTCTFTITGDVNSSPCTNDPCPGDADDDNDGVCNAVDICPGGDDLVDTDGDNIPDFCDPNPMIADGVLFYAPCLAPDTLVLLPNGTDGMGRNIYSENIVQVDMIYNSVLGRWELRAQPMGMSIFFISNFPSAPNPPDLATGSWIGLTGVPGCNGLNPMAVEGTGTQDSLGCDLAITNIDSMGGACSGTITVTATRTTIGGISYSINGPTNTTNTTGMFVDLPMGMYTITVRDSTFPDGVCTANGTATIMVSDPTPPTITCPSNVVADNDSGLCGAVVNYTLPTFDDNCPGATLTLVSGPSSGSTFPVGSTTVTYRVSDLAGNTEECSFTVTVNDTEPPTINCPNSFSVNNDPFNCSAFVFYAATANDNCGATVSYSHAPGSVFSVGTTTVTATATDDAGLTTSCMFTVTVVDAELPSISCPSDITLDNDLNECGAVVTFNVNAMDNCPGVSISSNPPSGSFFPVGVTTVFSTAVDAAGNMASCSFNVTVFDTLAPNVVCPTNIVVDNDPGVCSAVVTFDVTATDSCSLMSVVSVPASGSVFPVGITMVTSTATDTAGNTSMCSFTVTVIDTTPPTVTCPPNIVVDNDPGECGAVVMFTLNGADNCDTVLVTSDSLSGGFFGVGINTVTVTATDTSGNSAQCTFTVTVNDTESPMVMTQPATLYLDSMGSVTLLPSDIDNGSSDNCTLTLSLSQSAFDCTNVGLNVVDLIGNDGFNTPDSMLANVTVVDSIRPLLICSDTVMIMLDLEFELTLYVSDLIDSLSDACGIADTTLSQSFFDETNIGENMVTVTATDENGNVQTCVASVVISFDPASIPTLGQWGIIILCIFMLVVGILYLRRPIIREEIIN